MRRNFIHNCIVHPICGLIWLVADIAGAMKLSGLKDPLVDLGEKLHESCG